MQLKEAVKKTHTKRKGNSQREVKMFNSAIEATKGCLCWFSTLKSRHYNINIRK